MIKYGAIILVVISLVAGMAYGDVLFGPVVVEKGTPYAGTFGMHCACTAYFVEARNGEGGRLTKECTVVLNGETVLDLQKGWSVASKQVELRETEPNEIEIEVKGPGRSAATIEVYERDVIPAPMTNRVYEKKGRKDEEYEESFVLNHWARRFWLKVENGEEDGSGRVEAGIVEVNGVEVIGEDELHDGVYTISKEVELGDGMNRVQAVLEGDAGSKIQIGIEQTAQTVTVSKVTEVEVDVSPEMGGISTHDGNVMVRLSNGWNLVEMDSGGNITMRLEPEDPSGERARTMSVRGSYVWTTAYEGTEWVYRLYDWQWNMVHEIREKRGIQQVAETGDALLGWDSETIAEEPCKGEMIAVYDRFGTLVSKVPMGNTPHDFDIFNQFSPDGQYCWAYCNDNLQVYSMDGVLQWESLFRCSRDLANNGMAVQATKDSLLFFGSDGRLVRRVVTTKPANQCGYARTTPDGEWAVHKGAALMAAKKSGPQSCWKFEPGDDFYVNYPWISDDGKWFLAKGGITGAGRTFWLLGAGGQVAWESPQETPHGCNPRMLSEAGDHFYLTELRENASPPEVWCFLYHVIVE